MIHKHVTICTRRRNMNIKKMSLSSPMPTFKKSWIIFIKLLLFFMNFKTLKSLANFTSLYSLPILANLKRLFVFVAFIIKSNGAMAKISIVNQPVKYFFAIFFLFSTIYKYSL